MATFYLVRHGQARYDIAEDRRLIGGMRDLVPLTETGRRQAEQAADALSGLSIQAVVASPMTRAMETGHIIASRLVLPLAVEFDLHEWLPDLTFSYDSRDYVAQQTRALDLHGGEWPAGTEQPWEPLSRVRARVWTALAKYDHLARVAVVAHGTVIFALTGRQVNNCEVTEFRLPLE